MRITFVDSLTRRQINEASAFSVVAKFWDDSTEVWTASTPTSVRYRVDTPGGSQILDWTAASAASSVTINVPYTANAIQNDGAEAEGRVLTVQRDAGLTNQFSATYPYRVNNLVGQT